MNLGNAASVAQIISVLGGVLIGLWRIWRKIDQHQAASAMRSSLIEQRLDRIEIQFGPNGGGLREAVNRISSAVEKIDDKMDCVTRDVAKLSGEFKQHIRENEENK